RKAAACSGPLAGAASGPACTGGGRPGRRRAGRGRSWPEVGTLPATLFPAPGLASVLGGAAGDWNRAGQAQPGEAKGPDVGGHPAPFFLWPALRLQERPGAPGRGADARRERNRGDPVSPAGSRLGNFVALDLITSYSDATGQ